jgi:uncharacterized repeat protein (TIGR01451 family)/fimbrial isopeptide formation D2 family protein
MMQSRIRQTNAVSNNRAFQLWNLRVASVVLLAVALFVGVTSGRIRKFAALASGGKINSSNTLSRAKMTPICALGTNLIINGDAEADTAAVGDGTADQDVSAWENETGTFTVARYDTPGFPTSTGPGPSDRGTFMFVAGFTESSSASQLIDLSGCSAQIDGGSQQFNLSGFLGGFATQNDSVRVSLTFRDGSGNPVGTASVGPVLAVDRNNTTGMIASKSTGIVPVGARSANVLMQMTRAQGVYNDGYADNISFSLAAPTSCSPLPSGAAAWWKAEGNATDVLGTNNGVLHNGVAFPSGLIGQAFSFDGVDDYVSIDRSIQNDFTIEFWLNSTQIFNNSREQWYDGRGLVDAEVGGVTDDFGVSLLAGKVLFGTGRPDVTIKSTFVADGNWHHIAATRKQNTGDLKLYVDGLERAVGVGGTQSLTAPNRILLGLLQTNINPFQGKLDEVALYTRALSPQEIQAIYDAGIVGKCAPGTIQSLTLNPNTVNGGQPSTGTVTLTTPAPSGGALVNLSSNDASVATVPLSITIDEGQTTGTFEITTFVPVSDASALITASYQTASASASLTVLSPRPDLTISAASVPSATQTDSAFNVSWTVKNQGTALADAPWIDRVWLSSDNQISSEDTLVGEFPFSISLGPDQTADRIQTITIARNAVSHDGPYFLLIKTDAENHVVEGTDENNNFVARPINVTRQPRPDLVVESIVAPNTAFFGQTIPVQWTVKNLGDGPTNAQGWQDFVYLSLDNVPELEDPFRIPVNNVSYLAAGESYTATAEVKIPQGLVGQYKIIVWTDGDGTNHRSNIYPHQVVEDDDENNYGVARSIQINTPPLPDLQTVSVVAPEEVFAGGQMILNWRVENHGDGVTPPDQTNWSDKIYLSQDITLDVNTDRLVGSRPKSGALAQNEGYTVSNFNVTMPSDIAGDWFVFVVADGDNQVYEFNNEGNNANRDTQQPGSPMHIRATPPDLVIPNPLSAPTSGFSGQTLNVGWTVKNQGAFDAAPNWFDAVYLSSDQTLNTESDTLLTSVFRNSTLGPGLTYDVNVNVTLPPCISGAYYLFVLTDSRKQIFEFDPNFNAEGNNGSQPRPIQIADATPDLRVNAVSYPATGNAGQPVSVSWTVANQGAGPTVATKWTDRIYLTPTQTFDSATALLIGSFDHVGALNNGEAYTRTESIGIANTAQGNYFVSVLTDVNGEVEECAGNANNIAFGSQPIAVGNSLPDLFVQSASPQMTSAGGQTVGVDWTVVNQGAVAVNNSSWGDAVYFSSDAILGGDDIRLAATPAAGPLVVGATYDRHAQVMLPVVAPGSYFLIIQTDYLGNVFEGQHEDNNIRAVALTIQSPAIDLTVTHVDAPVSAFSGQDMTVSWTVLNNGTDTTIGSHWVDEVVLSLDQIDDPSDRVVGSKPHDGALNGQTSYNDSLSVFVPQGFAGQYYVFLRTDRRNEVAESSENNNSAADGVVFNLAPPADLVVSSIAPPSSASPGAPLTVNWTTQNAGTNPATGSWSDVVYLSSDQTWDINDMLVGKQTQSGPVAPGQSYNGQLTVTLPAINLGIYYVIVKTDAQNRVRETNETNNDGAAIAQTLIDVPELQIGVPRNTTLATGQERYYKTATPAGETLRFTLEGQAGSSNELFERFGLIATRSSFDFSFSRLNEPNQEVVVPNSQAGNYFTLARSAFSTPSPQAITVKTEVIPFGITSVSPNHVGDNGQVTITLKGARFDEGATVRLSGNGTTLNAAKVIRVDSSTVKARFMFANAPRGLYDVTLINPDGHTSTQTGAVTIEQARPMQPIVTSVGNLRTRPHRPLGFFNEVINRGNVDIQYVSLRTQVYRPDSSEKVTIVNNRPANSLPRKADFPTFDWNNAPPTNSTLGHLTSDNFLYRDLAPGEVISYNTEIRGLDTDKSYVRTQVAGLTRDEMVAALREAATAIWEELIKTDAEVPEAGSPEEFFDKVWEPFLKTHEFIEGVIEDVPSSYRDLLKSTFKNLGKVFLPDLAEKACHALVNQYVDSCGVRCTANFGCCNISTASDLAASVASFVGGGEFGVGIPLGIMYGAQAAEDADKCSRGLGDCANKCPKGPPNNCVLASADGEDFVAPCVDKPIDPNEKLAPDGYGEQRFVPIQQEIPYTINFENLPTATAYAQKVRITDHLDPNLDPRTLRVREIGFKQYRFQVPDNRAFFQQRVQLGPDLGNLLADISAGVDLSTGTVTWTLTAIDPATGEQPNGVSLGLLPPNNEANDGQGFVTFTVKAKSSAATGSLINNSATIIFDTEAPIDTNVVSNTLDAEPPASAIQSLPLTQTSPTFNISWSGLDAPNGSGLRNYDIFFSANNGPYQPLLSGTTATTTQFTGEPNTTYRFYSVARDNSGNLEAAPESPDAVTTVVAATPSANLSITKTASANPAEMERIFTYNITATNAGPSAATNVVVTDALPAGVTFTSATPSQGACSLASGTLICQLGSLAVNDSAGIALQVKPRQIGALSNTASVNATEPDPNTSNNSATSTVNVIKTTDLKIAKSDSPDPIFVGEQTTYTLLVTNLGPLHTATGVVLTDSLPSSMTFVSATTTQGSLVTPPTGSTGIVTANLGSLAVNAQATVTVTVTATQSGSITNTATVADTESDTNTANNTDSSTTTVKTAALQKVLLAKQVLTGGCENTTGQVYLTGPAPPGGVTVSLSSNITGASVPSSVFIPAGQSVSPTFAVTTTPVSGKQVGLITATLGASSVSRGLTINVGNGSCQ